MKNDDNQKFRILIVDDISKNIQVLGNILRNESYKTGFATSGEQALNNLKRNEFDLILLDIMMPGMDGFEVAQKVRALPQYNNTRIIFLTAKGTQADRFKGYSNGAEVYLTKPFDNDEFISTINEVVEFG